MPSKRRNYGWAGQYGAINVDPSADWLHIIYKPVLIMRNGGWTELLSLFQSICTSASVPQVLGSPVGHCTWEAVLLLLLVAVVVIP